MRVLYFHQHFSTTAGAAGIRSYEMAKALVKQGHEVTMVCGSYAQGNSGLKTSFKLGSRKGFVEGIKVIELNLSYSNKLRFWMRVFIFLKYAIFTCFIATKEKSDLVFCTSTPLTASLPGIFAKHFLKKKFVFEVRDLWPELPHAMGIITNRYVLWLLKKLELLAYRSADQIIGLSPGIVNGVVLNNIDQNRVTMIPNGCDFSYFAIDEISPCVIKKPSENFTAIFSGTHGKANGLQNILSAAEFLKREGRNNIEIILIGDGSEKDTLIKTAVSQRLNNIRFLDPIPKHDLACLFKTVDVGLQVLENIPAFYYGTSPNKFFDYLAAGLPVITNYPGWISELIEEHKCGLSVPPDNNEKLAEALIFLADNRELLPTMGKNSAKLGREKFARENLSSDFINVFYREIKNV
jgi:glycosyltransferase involved in cell wall biosynthesis